MFIKVFLLFTISISFSLSLEYQKHDNENNDNLPVKYEFGYSVNDENTGDIKSHQENSDGNIVHGRYELIDSDGYRRIVEYTADKHNGFNAVVHREPTDIKIPIPIKHHNYQQSQKIILNQGLNYPAPFTKILNYPTTNVLHQ